MKTLNPADKKSCPILLELFDQIRASIHINTVVLNKTRMSVNIACMLTGKLAFVDIETTGASLNSDRIIDIGILRVENFRLVSKFHTLIDPQRHLPREITQLTGITEGELKKAPTFSQVKDEIIDNLKDCVFVAHNAQFDYRFLRREFKYIGIPFCLKRLCTVRLSKLLYPQFARHNLDSLIERHGITCAARHRGFGDAEVLWDFFQKIQLEHPIEKIKTFVDFALGRPNVPTHLPEGLIDSLPETPGVYVLYAADGAPLYIGKSKNIKKRVLSHFTISNASPQVLKLTQNVTDIQTYKTAGEIGALLLESELVKKLQPLYNKRLRTSRELVVLKTVKGQGEYSTVKIEQKSAIDPQDLQSVINIFRSKKQATEYLILRAKEFNLCDKLLGLEKTKNACFGYSLKRCKGACIEEEEMLQYNIRFEEAFSQSIRPWPFDKPVIIVEENDEGDVEGHIIDKWCYLGTLKGSNFESNSATLSRQIRFDLDIYKIIKSFLKKSGNRKFIKPIDGRNVETMTSFL